MRKLSACVCRFSGSVNSFKTQTASSEPCGARKRDCNAFRGLVSIGNETDIERFREDERDWETRFLVENMALRNYD